jgi:hypothetical protein
MSVTYKVIKKCFIGGVIYDPEGKRKFFHAEKPFKKGKLPKSLRGLTDDERSAIKHAANQRVVKEAEQSEVNVETTEDKSAIEEAEIPEKGDGKAEEIMDFSGPNSDGKVEL